jgi:iron complex transport system substrate-binding protein
MHFTYYFKLKTYNCRRPRLTRPPRAPYTLLTICRQGQRGRPCDSAAVPPLYSAHAVSQATLPCRGSRRSSREGVALSARNSRAFFVVTLSQTRNPAHFWRAAQRLNRRLNYRTPIYAVRHAAALTFCFFVMFTAQAHSPAKQSAPATAPESSRDVSDETGRTVRIPVPVRRIVSLAPSLTESIYALGMQNLLVGDTDYCDYPEAAKRIHKVGGATNPSLEEIAQLRPDVVLVIKSLNRLETVQQLDRLGIPTYSTDPHTLDDIRTSVHRLADVLGNPAAGESLDSGLLAKEKSLQQKLQNVPAARVLFVVWTEPLISVGKHTFIADALAHAGATSVVDSSQDWPRISLEEIVRLQPDYLIFADSHSEKSARDVEALARRPGWDLLDAVKHRKFAVISDAVNRPAPRLFEAVEDLARQLHPEAFTVAAAFRGGRFSDSEIPSAAKDKN